MRGDCLSPENVNVHIFDIDTVTRKLSPNVEKGIKSGSDQRAGRSHFAST